MKNERRANSGMCTAIVACVPATMTNENGETVPFDITPERIEQVLAADYGEIAAPEDIYVPEVLIENDAIDALLAETSPSFTAATYHETTGVYQRTLSNGIRVNYKVLDAEPGSCFLRLVASRVAVPRNRPSPAPAASALPPWVCERCKRRATSAIGRVNRSNC